MNFRFFDNAALLFCISLFITFQNLQNIIWSVKECDFSCWVNVEKKFFLYLEMEATNIHFTKNTNLDVQLE